MRSLVVDVGSVELEADRTAGEEAHDKDETRY